MIRAISLALCLAISALSLQAVPIRVATFNVGGDFVDNCGICEAGTVDHDTVKEILARIDADVVCLQEIFDDDRNGNPSDLDDLASGPVTGYPGYGYPHIYRPSQTSLDFTLQTVILSKYPLSSTVAVGSPSGANEVARRFPAVTVNVPGTSNDPVIISCHLKSGTGTTNNFRRGVEMLRMNEYLDAAGLDENDNIIILGDFNLDLDPFSTTYNTLPNSLPSTYSLGTDIDLVNDGVFYSEFPEDYFSTPSLNRLVCRQPTSMSTATFPSSSRVIDHILISDALLNRTHSCEVYDSAEDTSNSIGLPKNGNPLSSSTSLDASDHYAVFGDFELDSNLIITATASQPSISEDAAAGAATLTIQLSSPPGNGETVVVSIVTNDATEAIVANPTLTFTTGVTSLQTNILPRQDGILDGSQTVTFTATALSHQDGTASIDITESDLATYVFGPTTSKIIEDFTFFSGEADPAGWTVSGGGSWSNQSNGSDFAENRYSFGDSATDRAAGLVTASTDTTFSANFLNNTGQPITALDISYAAEQWRASLGGTIDTWAVSISINGGTPTPITPSLDFTASTSLPTGAVSGGNPQTLTATLTNLNIPDGSTFTLRFTAAQGTGASLGTDDVFVNELHYDNDGPDQDEFVEIVTTPGFSRLTSDIDLILYNGVNGQIDETHTLNTFTLETTTPSGYRIYRKDIAGIQNGAPDGFALVDNSGPSPQVIRFLSYEGSFTGTEGPANNLTSVDVGVSQPASSPVGQRSIGLTGSGDEASDFSWIRFAGAFTAGAINEGQTFLNPVNPQGIAIDDVTICILPDNDLDGIPDALDPDDDNDTLPDTVEASLGTNPLLADTDNNGTLDPDEDSDSDGFTDGEEVLLLLTDPLDPTSFFAATMSPDGSNPGQFLINFPTVSGRIYQVQRSDELSGWTTIQTITGDGNPRLLPAPPSPGSTRAFFRILVSL
ncbi:MAG: endonuclease/exonuclease/phosphatase family protein [Verrucomicrobiota bacterium]